MTEEREGIRIAVTPEPTDEEMAAVAAVVTALAASASAVPVETDPPVDQWQLAGRREALRSAFWPPEDA